MSKDNIGYRVILGKKNSEWGIIINRYSGNRMENILSFDSKELRDEFINKDVFEGNDFKELIKKTKHKANVRLTALNSVFKINIADSEETREELLNKDFAVIEKNGEYTFWAINGTMITPQVIEYQAEKDIFMNRDIRTMFKNNKDSKIIRGMVNRVYKENNNFLPDFRKDSKLLFSEDIDNSISENNMILKEIKDIDLGEEYYIYFIISQTTEKNLNGLNSTYANLQEYITFESKPVTTENQSLSYLMLKGNGKFFMYGSTDSEQDYSADIPSLKINEYDYFHCIAVSSEIRNKNIYSFKKIERSSNIIKVEKHNLNLKSNNLSVVDLSYIDFQGSNLRIARMPLGNVYAINSIDLINIYNEENIFLDYKYDNDINKQFIPEQETKILKGIYTPWYLTDTEENKFNLYREYMGKNLEIDKLDSFSPFFNHKVFLIKSNNSNVYTGDFKYGIKYDSVVDNSIIRKSNEYINYLSQNISQLELNQRIKKKDSAFNQFGSIINIMNGLTQTGAGFLTGGGLGPINISSGVSNTVNGVQSLISSNNSLKMLMAQQQDLKNTPNKILGNANNEMIINKISNYSIALVKQELLWPLKYQLAQYFNTYGYNLNSIWDNINNYINTRYYYDFLQGESLYENFNEEVSGLERQVILTSILNGIHIWYVRDLETFKGIKNFNVNNVEMEFLNE